MRKISCREIIQLVAEMCVESNCVLSPDIKIALEKAESLETNPIACDVLKVLIENAELAAEKMIPICQDTGMAVIFVELGQEVQIIDGDLTKALNSGVAIGYREGFLRQSVLADPIKRVNTQDNTPAVIHYNIVPGDKLKLTIAPKGFGSENMSVLKMLKPSQGLKGVKEVVLNAVKEAGPNPCPPLVVGVGVGGTMEKAALLAKEALLRPIGSLNQEPMWQEVELELLQQINELDIGPSGFGGRTTALAVHINPFATHIAGLPVAVNIGCHVTRHLQREL